MKKELAAVALLLAIFLGSCWNGRHLESLLTELDRLAAFSLSEAEAGYWTTSDAAIRALQSRWAAAEAYACILLRQPEIDAVTEALCSLQGASAAQDAPACLSAVTGLHARLKSIRDTERLSFRSVF